MANHLDGTGQMKTKGNSLFNQIIVAFITISIYYINSLITVSSTHLASACNIQPNNFGVYISKLNTYRSLLTIIGSIISGIISSYLYQHIRYLSLSSLGLLSFTRLVLLITLYVSKRLGYHIYIVLVIEAFVFGMAHLSIVVSFPQYASAIILSTYVSNLFVMIIQFLLSLCIKNNYLLLFKIQCWSCLVCSMGSVGLEYYYLNQFYEPFTKSCKKINNELGKKITELYVKLEKKSIKFKSIENLINDLIKYKSKITGFKSSITESVGKTDLDTHESRIMEYIYAVKSDIWIVKNLIDKSKFDSNEVNLRNYVEFINTLIAEFNQNTTGIVKKVESINNQVDDNDSKRLKEKAKTVINDIKSLYSLLEYFLKIDIKDWNRDAGTIITKIIQISRIVTRLESKIAGFPNEEQKETSQIKQKLDELGRTFISLEDEIEEKDEEINILIFKWSISSILQFAIIFVSLFCQNFLHPQILPYSFIEINVSYKINIVLTIVFTLISGLICFFDNFLKYKGWKEYITYSFIPIFPQIVIFIVSLITIHSKSWLKCITNSTCIVLILTIVLIVSYCIVESVSYVSIANYVNFRLKYDSQMSNLLIHYVITVLFSQFLFSKISSGYNNTRVQLGYTFPDFNSKSSLRHGLCYWVCETLKATLVETISDLRFNIKNYT